MKHTILAIVTFLTGIALSATAAWYSIIGLTAIFAGAFLPIVLMGSTLEAAKLVAVSWLYHNWSETPKTIKYLMTFSVIILMFITSMGIFGFLSKAHIDQQVKLGTGVTDQIAILDLKVKNKEDSIKDIDQQIKTIDEAIAKLTDKGQVKTALSESKKQRQERDNLIERKEAIISEIAPIKEEQIKLESELKKVEAEVGPIKYVAELFFGTTDEKILDKSVRGVIILLIFVFDPLAILLLLAFNISLYRRGNYNMEFVEIKNEHIEKKPKRRRRKKEEVLEGGTF